MGDLIMAKKQANQGNKIETNAEQIETVQNDKVENIEPEMEITNADADIQLETDESAQPEPVPEFLLPIHFEINRVSILEALQNAEAELAEKIKTANFEERPLYTCQQAELANIHAAFAGLNAKMSNLPLDLGVLPIVKRIRKEILGIY
jgi:hypothetical protein